MGCFYHGIMISGPFERVISPLRKHINGDNNKWQTQRAKSVLFDHTKTTTKQNNKNPYHCLGQT